MFDEPNDSVVTQDSPATSEAPRKRPPTTTETVGILGRRSRHPDDHSDRGFADSSGGKYHNTND
ncbi:MAG: hypothetical protein WA021_01380 [Minisyncoccia bacterium]